MNDAMPEMLKIRKHEVNLSLMKKDYMTNILTMPELSRKHKIPLKIMVKVISDYRWEEELEASGRKAIDSHRTYQPASANFFWAAIENEYTSQDITLEMLAKKHGVSLKAVTEQSIEGKWDDKKEKVVERTREMLTKALFWKSEEFALRGSEFMDVSTSVVVELMKALRENKIEGMRPSQIKEVSDILKNLVPMGQDLFGLRNEGTGENKPTLIRLELMNSATHDKMKLVTDEKTIDIK